MKKSDSQQRQQQSLCIKIPLAHTESDWIVFYVCIRTSAVAHDVIGLMLKRCQVSMVKIVWHFFFHASSSFFSLHYRVTTKKKPCWCFIFLLLLVVFFRPNDCFLCCLGRLFAINDGFGCKRTRTPMKRLSIHGKYLNYLIICRANVAINIIINNNRSSNSSTPTTIWYIFDY